MDLAKYREMGSVPKALTLEQTIERTRREFDAVREHQALLGNVYVPLRLHLSSDRDLMFLQWMIQGQFDAYFESVSGNVIKYVDQKHTTIVTIYFVPKALLPDELQTLLSFLANA